MRASAEPWAFAFVLIVMAALTPVQAKYIETLTEKGYGEIAAQLAKGAPLSCQADFDAHGAAGALRDPLLASIDVLNAPPTQHQRDEVAESLRHSAMLDPNRPEEVPSIFTMANSWQTGYEYRRLRLCSKERLQDLDVPKYGVHVSMYNPRCCLVDGFDECENCSWETSIGPLCPTELADQTEYTYYTFAPMPRGKERVDAAGEKFNTMQRVRVETTGTISDMFAGLQEEDAEYLPHYYLDKWQTTMHNIMRLVHVFPRLQRPACIGCVMENAQWVFTACALRLLLLTHRFLNTCILCNADFSASIGHKHDGSLTCAMENHSNCEVYITNLRPRDELVNGVWVRRLDTECWFFIGPTTSKFKEADSFFHNVATEELVQHYKAQFDELGDALDLLLLFTDGCGGQYKGRKNFKRIAEFKQKWGIDLMHCFSVTAHGKGFHDALGKLISRILAKAETFKEGRYETSYQLYLLVKEKIAGAVAKVRALLKQLCSSSTHSRLVLRVRPTIDISPSLLPPRSAARACRPSTHSTFAT